jgi:hypothetical protein
MVSAHFSGRCESVLLDSATGAEYALRRFFCAVRLGCEPCDGGCRETRWFSLYNFRIDGGNFDDQV